MTAQFRNATGNDEIEVFTYSVFYVFYEQYLTIVNDAVLNLSICILAVTIITMLMLGKSSPFWSWVLSSFSKKTKTKDAYSFRFCYILYMFFKFIYSISWFWDDTDKIDDDKRPWLIDLSLNDFDHFYWKKIN